VYCAHAILIELLIVVAILGILAAVIIPNVSTFINTGKLNAARTEAENVKTAALAYMADYGYYPDTAATMMADSNGYLTGGALKATSYNFNGDGTATNPGTGNITLSGTAYPGALFTWNESIQTWEK
jgi:type II secretory pathway pseudopilin PulG